MSAQVGVLLIVYMFSLGWSVPLIAKNSCVL